MASRHDDEAFSIDTDKTIIQQLVVKKLRRTPLSHSALHSKAFSMMKSNEDRYSYARNMFPNLDDIFPDVKSSAQKCSATADILKTGGNNAFRLHQYEKAQELYTQSAAHAVPDHLDEHGKNTLALSIANRSGALFYSRKYKECLVDIENALQVGYPEDLTYKLYDRKGKCYQALNSYRAAELAFEVAAAQLNEATLDEIRKKTTLKQIKKNIEVCVRNRAADVEVNLNNLKGELPKLSDEPNATHPSLSSACEVEYRPGKGRCVVAARDIKPGEVLLVEKPFASVFIPHKEYKDSCHHCFYPCQTLLPCLKCSKGRYCSPECRDVSWETYHKYECGIPLGDLVGEASFELLALRIVLVAGLDQLLKFQQTRKPSEQEIPTKFKGCNDEGKYLSSDYTSVYQLQSREAVPEEFYFSVAFMSVFLTKLLEKMGFFDSIQKKKKETAMAYVGECLMSHLVTQFVQIAHHIPVLRGNDVKQMGSQGNDVRESIGLSVPSTYGLFNHSCDMETCGTFYGNNVVVHSLKSFKQGQEVTINYGQAFANFGKEIRQKLLRKISFFDCSCEPCLGDWPLLLEMSRKPTFKCTQCEAPLHGGKTDFFKCPRCKSNHSVKAKMESLNSATKLYEVARQSEDIQLLLEYIEAIEKLLVQPWRDYVACKGILIRMLWQNGSFVSRKYEE